MNRQERGRKCGGTAIPLNLDPAGLPADLRAAFLHQASHLAFRMPAERPAGMPSQALAMKRRQPPTPLTAVVARIAVPQRIARPQAQRR